ncbi:MAG: TRAP transporter small permease [Peptococcaceae bacterium]|nr:TRAP transporter small permease [Peptococcaceae bacterium]MDH7525410.1 TRAP transporter small permease [Peptococcaceae bacterium]
MGLKFVDRLMVKIAAVSSYIGAVWIFCVMVLVNSDVLGRLFFNSPIKGTPEIVQNSIAGLAFLMMGWATYQGRHVRSTMVKDKLPPGAGDAVELISCIIGGILFIGIVIASWKPMLLAWEIKDFQGEGALRVPTYPLWWIVIFGAMLSSWQCFSKVVKLLGYFLGKAPRPDDNKGDVEPL